MVDENLASFAAHDDSKWKLSDLAKKTNVNAKVLAKWRTSYRKDVTYRPGGRFGYHRQRFANVQERTISEMLRIQYVISCEFFGVWKSFDLDTRGELTKKFFSNKFVNNFCRRNALVLKRSALITANLLLLLQKKLNWKK